MEKFEDFNIKIYKKTGKYYDELNISDKTQILNEEEIALEKTAARSRAIIRRLRRELRDKL